jgi:hypothetical protein
MEENTKYCLEIGWKRVKKRQVFKADVRRNL